MGEEVEKFIFEDSDANAKYEMKNRKKNFCPKKFAFSS